MRFKIVLPGQRIKNENLVSLLLVLFTMVEIGTVIFPTSYLFRNILIMLLGTFSIIYCISKKGLERNRSFINFVFLYTICGIVGFLINHNADAQELLWPAAYMGIGLLLLNFKMPFFTVKWIYIIVSLVFIIKIVLAGGADNLIILASRNNISTYELQLWSLYMIAAYQNKKDANYWSILLGTFVSVISIGRGGILTFSIMLIMFMFYRYKKGDAISIGWLGIISYGIWLVIVAGVLYYIYSDFIEQMIYNFQWRGMNSKRLLIWEEYYNNAQSSFIYLFFGAPQRGSFWMDSYADNLHNSFLQLHAKYGIFMLGFIVLVLLKRCVMFFYKKQIYLLIPLIGMLVRMNFDYTNFNAMLDVIIVYYLLYPSYNTPERM